MRADEPGGVYQQTDYLYGVTTATSSWINTKKKTAMLESGLLLETELPRAVERTAF